MSNEIMNIIWSALGTIVTGLTSFVVVKFTEWINAKISDNKAAGYLTTIMALIATGVQDTYQTYVEALKKTGTFSEEAQKEALQKCLTNVKDKCAPEVTEYITKNFGDIDEYLKSQIESKIYELKNENKSTKKEGE